MSIALPPSIIVFILTVLAGIIAYLFKRTVDALDSVEEQTAENTGDIRVLTESLRRNDEDE